MKRFSSSTECPQGGSREDLPTKLLPRPFNRRQGCHMLAISETMAALLLCIAILFLEQTNLLQGQRRAP